MIARSDKDSELANSAKDVLHKKFRSLYRGGSSRDLLNEIINELVKKQTQANNRIKIIMAALLLLTTGNLLDLWRVQV